tara:strand:+ start:102 stop:758 length:657 start_codon:yes stop_codon:yes gene_type:complete
MKLSEKTISILKNYSTINQNLMITSGNTLSTMSAMKNIVAKAGVDEMFDKDVAIYDLNEFLACMSLFIDPELDFQDDYVIMSDNSNKLKYWYSDPSVVTTVTNDISMPDSEIEFSLSTDQYENIKKAAAVISAPDMVLEPNGLKVTDKKNDTANDYSLPLSQNGSDNADYKFWFKVENLKIMPGQYDVKVSSKNISSFKNCNIDIQYFIALEPESYYA